MEGTGETVIVKEKENEKPVLLRNVKVIVKVRENHYYISIGNVNVSCSYHHNQ